MMYDHNAIGTVCVILILLETALGFGGTISKPVSWVRTSGGRMECSRSAMRHLSATATPLMQKDFPVITRRWRKSTKQLATLGPASSSQEMIEKLFLSGADVFRLNFSHGEHAEKAKVHMFALPKSVPYPFLRSFPPLSSFCPFFLIILFLNKLLFSLTMTELFQTLFHFHTGRLTTLHSL